MQKSAIRQTISIALAAVIAVALFAFPAAASELSQVYFGRRRAAYALPGRDGETNRDIHIVHDA